MLFRSRTSPYFFNAGLINDGGSLLRLGASYAEAILEAATAFDMLFGPAYKGIPLVAAVAIAFADEGRDVPYAFNRKEVKDHGEGGSVIGAPLALSVNSCRGSTPAASNASRCKSVVWRSLSLETRM